MQMKDNNKEQKITMRIGKTTYLVGMVFKETTKETMDDKVRKMIRKEIQNGESA